MGLSDFHKHLSKARPKRILQHLVRCVVNLRATARGNPPTLIEIMKTDLSLAELLALVEIVDEHVDRNFPGVDPPRLLREIQQKLDTVITRHRKEIDTTIKSARKTRAAQKA